jgi:predicted PhzF superfamily epimerase YddE/YHI9
LTHSPRLRSAGILRPSASCRELTPDFTKLRAARGDAPFLGVIVTAAGSGSYDFVSRYFAPWVGIDEDPVTGATHCALTPYWASFTGKNEMRAYQASRRGGEMTVRLKGERVELVGDAVIIAAATVRLGIHRLIPAYG